MKLLMLGKKPPPIGGVTIHFQRLLLKLSLQERIEYDFKELSIMSLFKLIFNLFKYDKLHLHTSSPFVRLYVAIIGKISFCKTIVTFHGDIGRYGNDFLNYLDKLTIKLTDFPIVLNNKSYEKAIIHNKETKKISSFISPNLESEFITNETEFKIKDIKKKVKILFCTNAYNLTFDKKGEEIYGIYEIINFFKKNKLFGLIFSDPSGVYNQKFKEENTELTSNILIIDKPHSFYKVISLSDVNIRNTSTDGDSLSVKESLFLNKITMCTDVVSRPQGVFLYKRGELEEAILNIDDFNNDIMFNQSLEEITTLFQLYAS